MIEFRTPEARNANEVWDLDNLIKPTLDAMGGVFRDRQWLGRPKLLTIALTISRPASERSTLAKWPGLALKFDG